MSTSTVIITSSVTSGLRPVSQLAPSSTTSVNINCVPSPKDGTVKEGVAVLASIIGTLGSLIQVAPTSQSES